MAIKNVEFDYLTSEEVISSIEKNFTENLSCYPEMAVLAERLQTKGTSLEECRMIEDFFAKVLLDPDCVYGGRSIQTWSLVYLLLYERISPETISVVSAFEDNAENAGVVFNAKHFSPTGTR